MGEQGSKIEWCDDSWEVVAGCTKVSAGCKHCYAETLMRTRMAGAARKRQRDGRANGSAVDVSLEVVNDRGWNNQVRLLEMNLEQPMRRRTPTVYFVNSRSDLFHPDVPFEYIDRVFAVMALSMQHQFLVLTKRPERMRAYFDGKGLGLDVRIQDSANQAFGKPLNCSIPLLNVWLGTSVENQATADARLPELLACPAAGRFVSAEPLLGAVDLDFEAFVEPNETKRESEARVGISHCEQRVQELHWVIVGGESGPGARQCELRWIESVRDQCRDARVPVFIKQLGKHPVIDRKLCGTRWRELGGMGSKGHHFDAWPEDLRVREVPAGLVVGRDTTAPGPASGGTQEGAVRDG